MVALREPSSRLEASWVPGAGMLCCSLRHRGQELLAQRRGVAAYAERGKTMGIPLLYPWANRLAGFSYTVAGRTVELPHDPALISTDAHGHPIHGVVGGRLAWELTHSPEEQGSLRARLRWSASEQSLFGLFPFEHELQYAARLSASSLEVDVTVHASASDAVPLAFGFHPYLAPPGAARGQLLVELPPMRRLRLDPDQIPVGPDRELPAQRLALGKRELDDGFDMVPAGASFAVSAAGRRIELRMLSGYPCAQVYAPAEQPFVCFEPMTAPANALRSGTGLRLLAPGERARTAFSLSVAEEDQC